MEYTVLTLASMGITYLCDMFIFRTYILQSLRYYSFFLLVIVLHTIVDNYLNGRWFFGSFIVGNYTSVSGITIWHTPLENYGFGFSLITLTCIVYTAMTRKTVS